MNDLEAEERQRSTTTLPPLPQRGPDHGDGPSFKGLGTIISVVIFGILAIVGYLNEDQIKDKIQNQNEASPRQNVPLSPNGESLSVFDLRVGDCFRSVTLAGIETESIDLETSLWFHALAYGPTKWSLCTK